MKKLLVACFALSLLFSTIFIVEMTTVNAASSQVGYLKRKTRHVTHQTKYKVKHATHWTKRKTKYGYHKTKVTTKHTYSKAKDRIEH